MLTDAAIRKAKLRSYYRASTGNFPHQKMTIHEWAASESVFTKLNRSIRAYIVAVNRA